MSCFELIFSRFELIFNGTTYTGFTAAALVLVPVFILILIGFLLGRMM